MAISAYSGEKLKKHALQGTSLAVDPTRARERKTFGDLYSRARANPSTSRADLRESTATEFYGGERKKGLAAIANARGQIGVLGGEISDLEKRRGIAQSDLERSNKQAGNLARIISKTKYKKYKKQKKWQRSQLKQHGITDDFTAYKEGLGRSEWAQNMGAQSDALNYYRQQGLDMPSWAKIREKGPIMSGYLGSLGVKERAAKEFLPGSVASLAERRAKIGDLQTSITNTYEPSIEKARVYSGFFGGA